MGKMIAVAVIVIAIVGFVVMRGNKAAAPAPMQAEQSQKVKDIPLGAPDQKSVTTGDVKEFSMTSYYDEKGKWFSLKEIEVKKGDKVRIKVTNTKGTHDFTLDEYGIKKMTPLNEEVIIEFIAEKAGEFVYYCSVPDHREGGQWGTLKVSE